MEKEELEKITAALRTGKIQIVLQHKNNPMKNKKLIYNGNSGIKQNEKTTIYLVEE